MNNKLNRRSFMKSTFSLLGGAIVFKGALSKLVNLAEANELKALDPKDTLATTMKYVENAKKVKDAKGKCSNCQLYVKQDKKVNGKEVGSCAIFQGKLVLADAYCSAYVKKA